MSVGFEIPLRGRCRSCNIGRLIITMEHQDANNYKTPQVGVWMEMNLV